MAKVKCLMFPFCFFFRNFKGCHVSKDAEVADFFESAKAKLQRGLERILEILGLCRSRAVD